MEPLVGVQEAASLLRVPRSWIYGAVEAGRLPHIRVGRYIRFRPEQLRRWLDAQSRGECGASQ